MKLLVKERNDDQIIEKDQNKNDVTITDDMVFSDQNAHEDANMFVENKGVTAQQLDVEMKLKDKERVKLMTTATKLYIYQTVFEQEKDFDECFTILNTKNRDSMR